ncbi:MAG: hypothetical protein IPF75_18420 [Bacteroidetes bacterium]|nr:hypothetical protein [Bacteroidota bacterium]
MKTLIKQFLIVDDDPQNNSLSRMAIRKVLGNVPVKDFEASETDWNIWEKISKRKHDEKQFYFSI